MKKTIAALLTMCVILAALTGCGAKSTEADKKPEPKKPAAEATEATQNQAEEPVNEDTEFMYSALDNSTCEITGCISSAKKVVVPEIIDGFTVVGIDSFAFTEFAAEEVILPNTIEYISESGFTTCENLVRVDVGTGLKAVGRLAFNICPKLKTVSFPDGMTTIGSICFGLCDEPEEVYIPSSVTEIPDGIASRSMCPNIVIVTPAGSTAEEVATAGGLPVRNS